MQALRCAGFATRPGSLLTARVAKRPRLDLPLARSQFCIRSFSVGYRDADASRRSDDQYDDLIEHPQEARKPLEALHVKCTVFDSQAEPKGGVQCFNKARFCAEHGLQLRDLRKIEASVDNSVPTVLVRRDSILLNILSLRMLIKTDALYVFGSTHNQNISFFLRTLQGNIANVEEEGPFELRALESAFSCINTILEREERDTRTRVEGILEQLNQQLNHGLLRELLEASRQMILVQSRVTSVRELLDDLLEREDLASMYLTDAKAGLPRAEDDHDEIDRLLDSYSTQAEETENHITALAANVRQTRDVIELLLDSSRNTLLALDLRISIYTASLTGGAMFAAFFGMNLPSGLETQWWAGYGMAGVAIGISAGWCGHLLRQLRKARKVGLALGTTGAALPLRRFKHHVPQFLPAEEPKSRITRYRRGR